MAIGIAACGGQDGGSTASIPTSATGGDGTVSARSAPFQKYSGKGAAKLRIAEFGTEAGDGARKQAQSVIDAYLGATAEGEWGRACVYLEASLKAEIRRVAKRAAEKGAASGCGRILQALARASADASDQLRVQMRGDIASLRIREGRGGGFALFHGSDGGDYWMPVKREGGGEWRVLVATPQPFGED